MENDEGDEGPGADQGQLTQEHVPPEGLADELVHRRTGLTGHQLRFRAQPSAVVAGAGGEVVGGPLDGHP